MCGIIGYIGDKNATPILFNGLKKLEYRGYDSAGISVINNNTLTTIKNKGKVLDLENNSLIPKGNLGIGHCRWATHGQPNKANSHPHTDCKNEIAIVHNGIIENYYALKELLLTENHIFKSDTDSEVIVHLIEKFYTNNLEEAVIKAMKLLEGTFGLAVIKNNEQKIVATRRSSPLILGLGNKENFIASDATALLNHTKKVIYLNDNELAIIKKDSYEIKDITGNNIDKKVYEIKWSIGQIEKAGFKHFMLKEIYEQPSSIENTLRGRLKDKVKLSIKIPEKIDRIIITACGTSWHSALIGKYILEGIAKIPTEVDYASEFRYRNPLLKENDLIIVISQSGETADTLAALRLAKNKGVPTLGIVNVVGSSIANEVDSGIYLHVGPEIGVASTKAFTGQVTSLVLLAIYFQQLKNLPLDKKLLKELKSLPEKITQILKNNNIQDLAQKFKDSKNFLYLGRGINFPVALEGALKLKEISYIHAEGYPAAEMKHGPIALIDKNMPIFFIACKDSTYEKILSNLEEVKARKGVIIAIVNQEDQKIKNLADYLVKVPQTMEELSPIINIIPLQLFSYYMADLLNRDVDKPRNLAKSVTVE